VSSILHLKNREPITWACACGLMNLIGERYCFPRSKKRRIREKRAKRERNYRYKPTAYRAPENTIYCHPSIAARLRAELPPNESSSSASAPTARPVRKEDVR